MYLKYKITDKMMPVFKLLIIKYLYKIKICNCTNANSCRTGVLQWVY